MHAHHRGKRTRTRFRAPVCTVLLALIAANGLASATPTGIPNVPYFHVAKQQKLATGVYHAQLIRKRAPAEVVNVARLANNSPHKLKVVLSNGLIAGPEPRTERTSKMCVRVDCLLAVNGDFFADGMPVGGLVIEREPVRSPSDYRKQFSIASDGSPSIGTMAMTGRLVTSHRRFTDGFKLFAPPFTTEQRFTPLAGVNVPRPPDGIVLFTPRWGATTGATTGYELVFKVLNPAGRLQAGVDTTLQLLGGHQYGGTIPSDGVVLSGRGDGASILATLASEVTNGDTDRWMTLRVDAAPDAVQSVAGRELLVQDGTVVAPAGGSRAPRTMIGWNAAGDVLLVTVDGRQAGRSQGFTIREAADFMRRLGAVQAINLDGGGSTTFVKRGKVVNRPPGHGNERRVAVAVAIV